MNKFYVLFDSVHLGSSSYINKPNSGVGHLQAQWHCVPDPNLNLDLANGRSLLVLNYHSLSVLPLTPCVPLFYSIGNESTGFGAKVLGFTSFYL